MVLSETFERLCSATWKVRTLPDFIEASRIAGITPKQFLAGYTQPPPDPDVDSVGLGERAAGGFGGRRIEEHDRHETLRG